MQGFCCPRNDGDAIVKMCGCEELVHSVVGCSTHTHKGGRGAGEGQC